MKVWIVETSERYEESTWIEGVYATKELADEAAKRAQVDNDIFAYVSSEPRTVITELEPFEYPKKVQVWHTSCIALNQGILEVSSTFEYEGNYDTFGRGMNYVEAHGTDRQKVIRWALREAVQAPEFINGGRSKFKVVESIPDGWPAGKVWRDADGVEWKWDRLGTYRLVDGDWVCVKGEGWRMSDIYVDRYGKQWLAYHDPRFDHTMLRPEYADTDMATFTFEEVEQMHGPLTKWVKGNEYKEILAHYPLERLRAAVQELVTHGDLTPSGARVLNKILAGDR